MYLSVVIPVYCSEEILNKLYTKLVDELAKITSEFEIILVDDYSNDTSWKIIKEICSNDKRVKGIKLNKNYGQHNAIFCGIRKAKGEYILTMDDDLQHPPEEISKLIDKIVDGYDVVYGISKKFEHSVVRNILSRIIKYLIKIFMGFDQAQNINSFRIFKQKLMSEFMDVNNPKINIDVFLSWVTHKFGSVEVTHSKRLDGKSGYTIKKLINHSLLMLTNFSSIPLKIASYLGFVFSILGFLILCYVVITSLFYANPVPGFPFLASMISIFSGAQLLTLGIIGEYLSNIHLKSISKPMYKINEIINDD